MVENQQDSLLNIMHVKFHRFRRRREVIFPPETLEVIRTYPSISCTWYIIDEVTLESSVRKNMKLNIVIKCNIDFLLKLFFF